MDKQLAAFRDGKLQPGENIEDILTGPVEGGSLLAGRLILTDRRLCYFRKGMTGEVFETIPLDKITSVESKSSMGVRTLRAHTSHDKMAVLVTGEKSAFDRFYAKLEALRHQRASPPKIYEGPEAATAPSSPSSMVEQLRNLAELRDQGILTEEEFAAAKSRLISSGAF
jgi:hypothetical protein